MIMLTAARVRDISISMMKLMDSWMACLPMKLKTLQEILWVFPDQDSEVPEGVTEVIHLGLEEEAEIIHSEEAVYLHEEVQI
jgi:hypothetical protein